MWNLLKKLLLMFLCIYNFSFLQFLAAIYGLIKILMELPVITTQSAAAVYKQVAWTLWLLCLNWCHVKPTETTGWSHYNVLPCWTVFPTYALLQIPQEKHEQHAQLSVFFGYGKVIHLNLHQPLGFCKENISNDNHCTIAKLLCNKLFL